MLDLTHQLLVAAPSMPDSNFSRTVTYVLEHNKDGAVGLIINQLSPRCLRHLFAHVDIECRDERIAARHYQIGGPVGLEQGFILFHPYSGQPDTMQIDADIGLSCSHQMLNAIAQGGGPQETLIMLGYAGWQAGQLEYEFAANGWLNCQASQDLLFELPLEQRWETALERAGVPSPLNFDAQTGHA